MTTTRDTPAGRRACRLASALAALLAAASAACAADGAPGPAAPAPAGEAAVPAQPRQTSASFGDWVVRCDTLGPAGQSRRVCEAAQSIVVKDQAAPIAQVALGRPPADKPDAALLLTVLLPASIAFDRPPRLGPGPGNAGAEDPGATLLTFRRCLPGGCFADARLDAPALKALRDAKGLGHLAFTDAGERTIAMPVSFRGLAQALDDLAAETSRPAAAR